MGSINFADSLLHETGSVLIDASNGEILQKLRRRVARLAGGLQARGLSPGNKVVLVCEHTPHTALAYLACIFAGLTVIPVDAETFRLRRDLVRIAGVRGVWSEKSLAGVDIPTGTLLIQSTMVDGPETEPVERKKDDLALLMPTSGSTQESKLVMVTHGNLLANTEAIVQTQRLGQADRAMLILPLHYCFGASVFHSHLRQGGSVVFDKRFMFPDKVLWAINQYQCTTFAGVPTTFKILLHRSGIARILLPSLRRVLQAGGPLDRESIARLKEVWPGTDLYIMYGQTEATARISTLEPEKCLEKPGSVGRPVPHVQVKIMDEGGHEVAWGTTGEILVRGASICPGYWDAPPSTREKFVAGWMRTGDLGHLDQDGYLWIDGRKHNFIKVRGIRVNLEEVETLLVRVEGIEEAGACAVPHAEAGEALAVFAVSSRFSEAELKTKILATLPPKWTCSQIHQVTNLPRTANGKLSRPQIKEMALKHAI